MVTTSSGLIAGSRVLHRLLMPSHPPCALGGSITPTRRRGQPLQPPGLRHAARPAPSLRAVAPFQPMSRNNSQVARSCLTTGGWQSHPRPHAQGMRIFTAYLRTPRPPDANAWRGTCFGGTSVRIRLSKRRAVKRSRSGLIPQLLSVSFRRSNPAGGRVGEGEFRGQKSRVKPRRKNLCTLRGCPHVVHHRFTPPPRGHAISADWRKAYRVDGASSAGGRPGSPAAATAAAATPAAGRPRGRRRWAEPGVSRGWATGVW